MTVEEIILAKMNLEELTPLQEILISETESYIKGYCHIEEVPTALNYTWANMTIDAIVSMTESASTEGVAGPLSGLTMGDVSYSFADRQTATDRYNDIARGYTRELNRYRRGLLGDVIEDL